MLVDRMKLSGHARWGVVRPTGLRAIGVALVIAASAAAVLFAGPATAASRDGDNPVSGDGLLSTSVVYGRKWTATFSLNTLADSNFRRVQDAESALRITPTIDVGVGMPVGRQQLFIGGELGRDFVLNHSEFNTGRYAIGGGVAWRVGARCSGLVGGDYRSRLNQVFEQAGFTPNVQNVTTFAGSASCQTATGLGFGGSVRHTDIANERAQREPFNLRSTVFDPNISYGTPTIGQFSLGATFNNTVYPFRFTPTLAGAQQDGVKIFSGRVGYSRNLGSRLQFSAGASYLKSKPKPDVQLGIGPGGALIDVPRTDFSGSGFDLSLAYQPSSRMTVDLSASRNVNASANVGALFTVTQGYSANVGYKLSPRLDFSTGVSRLQNDYKESFTSPDEPLKRISDRIHRIYAQLDYSPVPLYSVGLVVAHQWRNSNPANFDFKSTTARLRLTVKFGRG